MHGFTDPFTSRAHLIKVGAAVRAALGGGWLVFGLASALTLGDIYLIPAFQAPDEHAHLLRAEQLSYADLLGENPGEAGAGGYVDAGLLQLLTYNGGAPLGPPTVEVVSKSMGVTWRGEKTFANFPNTLRYAPFFYLPQTMGLWLGRTLGWSVLHSVYAARVFNALLMSAVVALALSLARRGQLVLAFTFFLPMAFFEMSSASQDGGIIAFSILAAALVTRSHILTRRQFYLLAASILMLALARFPLVGLLPLLWLPSFHKVVRRDRWLATAISLLIFSSWFIITQKVGGGRLCAGQGGDTRAQLAYLLANPQQLVVLPWKTISAEWRVWWRMMVGVLGWHRIRLSERTYTLASIALWLACGFTASQPDKRAARERVYVGAVIFTSCMMMLWATYLTWSAVGHPIIEGMQGRYFLPILPFLVVTIPEVSVPLRIVSPTTLRALKSVVAMLVCGLLIAVAASSMRVASRTYKAQPRWALKGNP